jgi:hypothetical protein
VFFVLPVKRRNEHVGNPERSGEPDATLRREENLKVLQLVAGLAETALRELLSVGCARTAGNSVLRGERRLLSVVRVKKLEVVESETRLRRFVELGDLVENVKSAGVIALGEQELGRFVEGEDSEAEEEDGCGEKTSQQKKKGERKVDEENTSKRRGERMSGRTETHEADDQDGVPTGRIVVRCSGKRREREGESARCRRRRGKEGERGR